ncbi:quinolinate phosphoribosyltransferase [Burkholderia cenocepacia]|nr:quinolinate phosphoribosyltransferase [Burkholderia cenocepacia]
MSFNCCTFTASVGAVPAATFVTWRSLPFAPTENELSRSATEPWPTATAFLPVAVAVEPIEPASARAIHVVFASVAAARILSLAATFFSALLNWPMLTASLSLTPAATPVSTRSPAVPEKFTLAPPESLPTVIAPFGSCCCTRPALPFAMFVTLPCRFEMSVVFFDTCWLVA